MLPFTRHQNKNFEKPSPLILVEQMHLIYGKRIRMIPVANIQEREQRVTSIGKHVEKLHTADKSNQFLTLVHSLAQTLYAVYSAALSHGINLDLVSGHKDHISPATSIKAILKTEGAPIPKQPKYVKNVTNKELPIIEEAFFKYRDASNKLDAKEIANTLNRLSFLCYRLAILNGINIDNVLQEVHDSNLSKLDKNGKVIFGKDKEIISGPNFFTPRISNILKKQGWDNTVAEK